MASLMKRAVGFLTGRPSARVSPFEERGVSGTPAFGGVIHSRERHSDLSGSNRWVTASNLLSDVSIVAAGLRYFLNLAAKPAWIIDPADETDEAKEVAEFIEEVLYGADTAWTRIVRRSGMYRFHGFTVQEWIAKKRDDGKVGLRDVEPRPCHTIERWDMDEHGAIMGMFQRSPQDGRELYLPRKKVVYLVDDMLTDSPEGMGWYRALAAPARQMRRYAALEAIGFERDLSGIPIARAPISEMNADPATWTPEAKNSALEPLRNFISLRSKEPDTGLLLDSATYNATTDTGEQISAVAQWGLELLTGESGSIPHLGTALGRLTYDMARIMGIENMLTGSDGAGSRALSEDKSRNLYLSVNSTLQDMGEGYSRDLINIICDLNGIAEELRPKARTEDASFKDVEMMARVLKDMSTAGAVLAPDDPAIDDMRDLMGLPPQPEMTPERMGMLMPQPALPGEDPLNPGAPPAPGKPPAPAKPQRGPEPTEKAAPRSLYVQRKLLNAAELIRWAKAQGFKTTTPAEEMHVTVTYSSAPVDWMAMGTTWNQDRLVVPEGGPRLVEPLGDKGAVVLLFRCPELEYRHDEMLERGASFDFPGYQPHVTITYDGAGIDLDDVDPFTGELRFGPEIFEEINEDWKDGLVEKGFNPNQPRHPAGNDQGGEWSSAGGGGGRATIPKSFQPRNLNELSTHPAVDAVDDGRPSDHIVVSLAPGFYWSEQSSFGTETVGEALRLFRSVYWEGEGSPPWLEKRFNPNQPRVAAGDPHGGRWTDGDDGGGSKVVALDAQTKRDQLVKPNEGKTLEELRAEAVENQNALRKIGGEIEDDLGIEFQEPPKGSEVKTMASLERKIRDDGYAGAHEITDISRATFVVDSPDEADKVIERLSERGTIYDKGWTRLAQSGYLDRKIYIKHPNNGISEVQLVPRGVHQIKSGLGHRLYEIMRVPSNSAEIRRAAARKSRRVYLKTLRASGFITFGAKP